MQIIGRSVCAALAMGNATVIKPAEEACLSALAFAELARQVGFPPGVINVVPGLGGEAGAALAGHRRRAARLVHRFGRGPVEAVQQAAACRPGRAPVTLELGGKSAQLVFDDADLDAALPFLIERRHPERRPDLFGSLSAAGAARRARRGGRPAGGALS